MSVTIDYLDAVLNRGRDGMEPNDFEPSWGDRPRKQKFYPGVQSLPLPTGAGPDDRHPLARGLDPRADDRTFDLELLGGMLQNSYAHLMRRLTLHANEDVSTLPRYAGATWSRGVASGGGLYPVSIYWAAGPSGPLVPGIYYYSPQHHAVQRLLTGDVTADVRAALGPDTATDTDQYLLLGIKFWQNAFKYNNFSYHTVTMDIGTLVQTWRMWAQARGAAIRPVMWFDEDRLNHLLGTRPDEEGVFAAVPLDWAGTEPSPAPGTDPAPDIDAIPSIRHRDAERSRIQLDFATLQAVHAAARVRADERPARGALRAAAPQPRVPDGELVDLPDPLCLDLGVDTALRSRRSSFGRFSAAGEPMSAAHLATLLRAAHTGGNFPLEVRADDEPGLASLYVFVNHVEGVSAGTYEYRPAENALRLIHAGEAGAFLQQNYFLANYNLEQAAAVIVPAVRGHDVLTRAGDSGYRIMNATIGAVTQTLYTTSAALGLGCGAALGFDNISYIEHLDLAGTGESPLIIVMVGREGGIHASLAYDIV